jgi:ferric-dicitrate binding protein FerR (iron transport regulator)
LNIRLIARYLAGECTKAGETKVEQWAESDPSNKDLMKDFRQIWNALEKENKYFTEVFDPEEDWEVLRHRMVDARNVGNSIDASVLQLNKKRSKKSYVRFTFFIRVAAIILFATLIGIVAYQNVDQKQPKIVEPVLREIALEKGQRGNITLSDGTKVTLNAESKIIMPKVFKGDKREITLHGQAFFEVSHNPDRPFIINTNNAVIQVLGTSLDVRSYPEDSTVQVVVKEGRVTLKSSKECCDNAAILSAGERGQLFVSNNRIAKNKVDDFDLFLSWTQGYLKFEDIPVNKVAEELERKYDIEIEFENSDLKTLRLTAELKSRTIQHNMDVIARSLGMEYKMNQQVITFFKSNE